MSRKTDAAEHSIELHLPFVAHCFRGHAIQIVPVMVGALTPDLESSFGELLAPYLDDPENFFVISSDFCHWGARFDYVRYDRAAGDVSASIEALDRMGMACIERQDAAAFTAYLQATKNTICGRHPIGVLLHAMRFTRSKFVTSFTRYAQSGPISNAQRDTSVSYASATVIPLPE